MGSGARGVCKGHWSRLQRALDDTLRGLCVLLPGVVESSQKFLNRIVRMGLSDGQLPEPHSH